MKVSNRNFIKWWRGLSRGYSCTTKFLQQSWAGCGRTLAWHCVCTLKHCSVLLWLLCSGRQFDKACLLRRYSRYGFINSTFASLAVQSLSSWFCLFPLVSAGSNRVVAVYLTSPVCPVSNPSANTELECSISVRMETTPKVAEFLPVSSRLSLLGQIVFQW